MLHQIFANLVIEGYDFAPTFSIWTTIEECLNPPVIWEKERGFYTTKPFSEPETFFFPEGIGEVECVKYLRVKSGVASIHYDIYFFIFNYFKFL